ncbi:hypothetical protein CYMTET_13671 [Cymbomonas tetramitiformis]|uniref:Polymorphic outer membrane protein n=1 Tax=Cymbomonas tetramitiformis TaxID=36881 RepID=A0AAE0LAN0_9CHLO|nr:hypothetical protein CYMTET_13671 [Cymbomonas tetramitiformis]
MSNNSFTFRLKGKYFDSSTLIITNSTLSDNSASSNGGVAKIDTGSTCIITTSAIRGNNASSYGGVTYVNEGSTLIITNSTLSDNSAVSAPQSIYTHVA